MLCSYSMKMCWCIATFLAYAICIAYDPPDSFLHCLHQWALLRGTCFLSFRIFQFFLWHHRQFLGELLHCCFIVMHTNRGGQVVSPHSRMLGYRYFMNCQLCSHVLILLRTYSHFFRYTRGRLGVILFIYLFICWSSRMRVLLLW